MIKDLLQVIAIFLSIVQRNCDTFGTEATRTANSVQVIFCISDFLVASTCPLDWHVEIDNDLDFRDVNTTSKHVSSDDNADLASPELTNHFVTLLRAHVAENDGRFEVLSAHHAVEALSIRLSVHKDHSLSHLTNIEDGLEEVRLLTLLALELILLDVIEMELFLLQVDLLGLRREHRDLSLDIVTVGGREENVLHFGCYLRDMFLVDLFQHAEVAGIVKEDIGFIDNKALKLGQIELL